VGDRGNVTIDFESPTAKIPDLVYLYTHWSGSDLPRIVAAALARGRERWDDDAYLARIIFSEMTKGQEGETTGFGISTTEMDNENPIVNVRPNTAQVEYDGQVYTFEGFIAKFGEEKQNA
jgi:hypothetical protein